MTPKIPTFVIGVGSSLSNLNGIAVAGGTQQAYLVDTGGNVNQQFLAAMNAIRHSALGCVYSIPTAAERAARLQRGQHRVSRRATVARRRRSRTSTTKADCPASGNGWYYDNPAAPTQIILCDTSCSGISVDTTGSVEHHARLRDRPRVTVP